MPGTDIKLFELFCDVRRENNRVCPQRTKRSFVASLAGEAFFHFHL